MSMIFKSGGMVEVRYHGKRLLVLSEDLRIARERVLQWPVQCWRFFLTLWPPIRSPSSLADARYQRSFTFSRFSISHNRIGRHH